MRDATSRGGGRRNGPSSARAARRSDPYARDSRARPNAPASQSYRDQKSTSAPSAAQASHSQAGMSYPPPELSIRGSSGPTWIVVSNLVAGTSNEDVRLTFSAFGRVEEVKQRPAPSANHPTVAFEVAFERREDAQEAVEKFNGALADGRILQVSIKKPDVPRDAYSQFNRATAQAAAQRPREKGSANLIPAPAPLPYTPTPAAAVSAAIPTGPASMRSRAHTAGLVEPRAKKANGATASQKPPAAGGGGKGATANKPVKAANKPAIPTGPKKGAAAAAQPPKPLAQRIPEPLANRLLTPAQAQKLRAEEARKKAKEEARAKAIAATGKNTVLGKRLGGLPLAQRLVQQAGTPKSDQSAIKAASEKKKRKKEAAKAKKTRKAAGASGQASGMELDG